MNRLRRLPTPRLLGLLAAVVLVGAGATVAATAALGGRGPVPPRKPLARALHDALSARPVEGVTARISFSNRLVDAGALQGANPLLSGATGRLWLGRDGRARIELQSRGGDAQIVSNGRAFSVYDGTSNTVYRGELPRPHHAGERHEPVPTVARIEQALRRAMRRSDLSGAEPGSLAGRPAYTLRVSPRADGGLVGGAALAWDAVRGVPLRLAVYARGRAAPVLELAATDVSYAPVPASTFALPAPAGAKVTDLGTLRGHRAHRSGRSRAPRPAGVRAARAALPFRLSAPAALAGRPRQDVLVLGRGKEAGARISYGDGLAGVHVFERPADPADHAAPPEPRRHGHGSGLNLPRVSVRGAPGTELVTPLGTVIRFERGGVAYTVIASAPRSVVEAAARGL